MTTPKATFYFPKDFRWGTATSSHQVEGNNVNNDWWAWEREPGRILEDARSGLACNWWENAEADLNRAADMGNNAHRLSIEWSRVEPEPNVFDRNALDRYRQIIQAMHRRGIEPMVTLHHFTNPLWLADNGGWAQETVVEYFARYVRNVVESLGNLVQLWITINEPMIYVALAYLQAKFPPGEKNLGLASRAARNMLKGHAAAYHLIHDLHPYDSVGIARNVRIFEPADPRSLLDRWATRNLDRAFNVRFNQALLTGRLGWPIGRGQVKGLTRTLDFIGLNYYTRERISFSLSHARQLFGRRSFSPGADLSDNNYSEIYPPGMYQAIKRVAAFQRPIYITENGLPDADDDQRPRFILSHLRQVWAAIQHNIPVMGYYHWSLIDNFEWDRGWVERFGLISLDPATQARTLRRSGELYRRICRSGCLDWDLVHGYAPEILDTMFPR